MYLWPNPPFASLPICFHYNHFPTVHSPCTFSLALARSPSLCHSPASQLPACHLQHLSLFPPEIPSSLGKSSIYRRISIRLELCVCTEVSWLLGREGENYCASHVLCKPGKETWFGHILLIYQKLTEICWMFLKPVILIHWCFRAIYAGRLFTSWQTATWVWCRDNEPDSKLRSSSKPWSKFAINQGR